MIKIGVTGNMGAGKSTVCAFLADRGIPLYNADDRAKTLMATNDDLISKIQIHFGNEAYKGGQLNRQYLANQVFNNSTRLQELNELVHPAVHKDFNQWLAQQIHPLCAYESAIIYEHNRQSYFDIIVLVTCPENLRLDRIQKRDGLTIDEIKSRMRFQWHQDQKIELADYVIENSSLLVAEEQLDQALSAIRTHFNIV